jgi:hypothetical protein
MVIDISYFNQMQDDIDQKNCSLISTHLLTGRTELLSSITMNR